MRQLNFNLSGEIVIDLFAGGGGASLGIERALGRPIDEAVNHDPVAIAMHEANHPATRHWCEEIREVSPREVAAGRPVGLIWASPDCFPAGTLVLTKAGYLPIEEVQVGDEVLTHKQRWRRVTETSSAKRPLMLLKGHGHPGLQVSPEHPFYARLRRDVWDNSVRSYRRTWEKADWIPASALDRGWYWASPTRFPHDLPPSVGGRGLDADADLLWLAGRYLGDGWTRLSEVRAELVITCGNHEADDLREDLSAWPRQGERAGFGELAWHERTTSTATQFSTNHRGLVEWLREHFGHGAEAKRIPGWALGMERTLRRALLSGYLSADGWSGSEFQEARTVSKALAFGLKHLAASLGYTPTVYRLPNNRIIEGRAVNARDIYMLRWRHEVASGHSQTFNEDGLEWAPIRSQEDVGDLTDVFNIGVEGDESYVVEGVVAHNCKHFSKAKGAALADRRIRSLAWIVLRWVATLRPRLLLLENVEEFQDWGPVRRGKPLKGRRRQTFEQWVSQLRDLGYQVEWEERAACDFGAPTTRKRLYLIARRDGLPIRSPVATHGPGLAPYRTAASDVLDFSRPCPSIFMTAEDARAYTKATGIRIKRPLAEKTMRRIARGVWKFVINAADPFIVPITHTGDSRVHSVHDPLRTVTCANRGEFALCAPYLIPRYGERDGQEPRCHAVDAPAPTVVPTSNTNLVTAFLAQNNYMEPGHDAREPVSTIVSRGSTQSLVAAHLVRQFGMSVGSDCRDPAPTVTSGGMGHTGLVTSHMIKLRGTCAHGQSVEQPAPTVTSGGSHLGLVASSLVSLHGKAGPGGEVTDPIPTITASAGHVGEVRSFLLKYYGTATGQRCDEPLHAATSKARFGLVTVQGVDYQIADIGMRMLTPRELFRAQGFPDSYIIDPIVTKTHANSRVVRRPANVTEQNDKCGNSVCPAAAEAYVRANLVDMDLTKRRAA